MKSTGKIHKGWEMTKSAWRVLKLDKELASLPLISFVVSLVALVPFGIVYLLDSSFMHTGAIGQAGSSAEWHTHLGKWTVVIMAVLFYFIMTLIANFFSGAIIYGATERFRGGDPTVRSSLAGARRKFEPLVFFSLMMTTVGLALQALEDRVPLAGKIAVWLVNASWSIANVFAVPVIVLSEENVHPFDATKRSVGIVKKVWGESVIVDIGISSIAALVFFGYLVTMSLAITLAGAFGAAVHASPLVIIPLAIVGVGGIVAILLIFSTLIGIAKAALYHYATTGEAPEAFSQKLLHAAMTPKKARKIFK